jgi:hypothetical protein
LKRSTPSFTVEYRQTKRRLHRGGAKLGSAQESSPPIGLNGATHRVAISAFKTPSAKQPGEVVANSIPAGRVLPSLVEADPVTGQSSRGRPNTMVEPRAENPGDGGAKSTSYGGARQVEHTTPTRTTETAARPLDNRIHAAEGLEAPLGAAGTLVPEQPVTPRLGVGEVATPRSKNEWANRRNGGRTSAILQSGRPADLILP